ncbi:MAG: helix-turn-helix domain-containing protein [Promethearchaeota archaeon]
MLPSNPIALTIILIFGIQAIVLVVLILKKRPIKQSNIFLALILFFFALISIDIALNNLLYTFNKTNLIRYFQLQLLFGIGPSLYFFTKCITDPDYHILPKEYIHFIPVILEFIYYRTNIYQNGLDYRMEFYENGLTSIYQIPLEPFSLIYIFLQWLAIASVIIYIFLSVRLFHRYKIWVKRNYSNLTSKSLGWLKIPLLLYSAFWISWVILRLIDTFIFQNNLADFYLLPTFIGMSVVTSWIGFKGYVKSQIDAIGFSKESLKVKSKSTNPEVAKEIINLMLTQKPYLNPDLDLLKLSEMIDMNSKIVSQIINTDLEMNFYEFINKYRVEEFKHRLRNRDSDKFSLMGIAYDCGFNSKSTFNHVFKKITGQTPSEYKNQH